MCWMVWEGRLHRGITYNVRPKTRAPGSIGGSFARDMIACDVHCVKSLEDTC
jgi:hypothetical protein